VFLDEINEVPLRKTAEGAFAEMRVLGNEILWASVDIGEIAAPTAGDADFLPWVLCVIQNQCVAARVDRAHHAGGAGPKNNRIPHHGCALPETDSLVKRRAD
jgi:hypothetical protein